MNFLEETKFRINQYYEDGINMVDFVKIVTESKEYQITWENFEELANFEYMPIYEVPGNRDDNECVINTHSIIDGLIFIVFKDGSYLRRSSVMDSWTYIPTIRKKNTFDTIIDRAAFKVIDRKSRYLMMSDYFYF